MEDVAGTCLTVLLLSVIQKGKNPYVMVMNVQIVVLSSTALTIRESTKSGRNQEENRSGGTIDYVVRTVLYLMAHLPSVILLVLTLAVIEVEFVVQKIVIAHALGA